MTIILIKRKKEDISRCMIKSALYVDFCACFACEVEKKNKKCIII